MILGERKVDKSKMFCIRMLSRQLPASLIVALSMAFSDMADALVLGNRIGEIGLAAISLSAPIYMIMNIVIQCFGSGGSIRYATFMAEGKKDKAMEAYRSAIKYAFYASVLIALFVNLCMPAVLGIQGTTRDLELYGVASLYLRIVSGGAPIIILSFVLNDYMRNEDMEKEAGAAATIGNVLDIVLNVILVLFLRVGIVGAAISTVTGKTVSLAICYGTIWIKKSDLRFVIGKTSTEHIFEGFKTGASTVIRYFSDMVFLVFVNHIVMKMAGQSGVAVFDIIQNVSYILMYLYLAFAEAGQPAISTYSGEKNIKARIYLKKLSILLGEVLTCIIAMGIFIYAKEICSLFGVVDGFTLEIGQRAIRQYTFSAPIMGALLILEGYYQSCDNKRGSYMISALRQINVLIPVTILYSFTNIYLFFGLYFVTESISLILFMIYSKIRNIEESNIEESRVFRYFLENVSGQISVCCESIEVFCENVEANPKQQYFVQMAVEELVGAITKYAETKQQDGNIVCEVTVIAEDNGDIVLHIRDNATEFNPFEINRRSDEIIEDDLEILGVGVIKKKSKEFFYRRYQGFNSLVITI